jgi:hypothetical protein
MPSPQATTSKPSKTTTRPTRPCKKTTFHRAWVDATCAADPVNSKLNPPTLRAPTDTVQDAREFWAAGKPLYDPGQIKVPVFPAHAEWDQDLPSYMLYAYFEKVTNATNKRYVQIGEGTHTVIMKKIVCSCLWRHHCFWMNGLLRLNDCMKNFTASNPLVCALKKPISTGIFSLFA